MKKTKVLATLGPASSDRKTIRKLISAGMDAVRINTSHGDKDQYSKIIRNVRAVKDIPIILDTQGPEIRIRCRQQFELKHNQEILISDSKRAPLHFSRPLAGLLKHEQLIFIEDGILKLRLLSEKKKGMLFKTMSDGRIRNGARVNIPSVNNDLPILTSRDREILRFGIEQDVDFVALSYTRNKDDVRKARKLLGPEIGIISKIENEQGVSNIVEIIEESDGVMVARGDLGVEIPSERLPMIQKMIIKKCNQAGKLVITATQMLETMISNPRPTRAETSDVANAILDGTDVVMLSGETAVGKYPVSSVAEMTKIAAEVERHVKSNVVLNSKTSISEAISKSIYEIDQVLPITKVVTLTRTGYTAKMISRFRMNTGIIAVTADSHVKKKLELYYGVTPMVMSEEMTTRERIIKCTQRLHGRRMLRKNDLVLYTAGILTQEKGFTNLIEVHRCDDILKLFS